jgi:dihydroflavonol-4-reductase
MKRVLITGGTGFVGANLAEALLKRGCEVRVLRRRSSDLRALAGIDVEHFFGDVRDSASLKEALRSCDTVFHTAAIVKFWKARWNEQFTVNVEGTRNVVNACLSEGVNRFLHVSSIAALGHPQGKQLANEDTPYNWVEGPSYKYSKRLAELEVLEGVKKGLSAVIVNPSVIIGERDIYFHGGSLLTNVKKGTTLFYIDGGMNVVYVGDVVKGIIRAAEKGAAGERYILGGVNMTTREVFTRTAELIGGRSPIARVPIPLLHAVTRLIEGVFGLTGKEPPLTMDLMVHAGIYNWYSSAKAERELGYTISPFDGTILAAYRWYRQNGYLR